MEQGIWARSSGIAISTLHFICAAACFSEWRVLFRHEGAGNRGKHVRIQSMMWKRGLSNRSLYGYKELLSEIEPEKWYLLQLVVKGKDCVVRKTARTSWNITSSRIWIQAASCCRLTRRRWIEYKQIRIKRYQLNVRLTSNLNIQHPLFVNIGNYARKNDHVYGFSTRSLTRRTSARCAITPAVPILPDQPLSFFRFRNTEHAAALSSADVRQHLHAHLNTTTGFSKRDGGARRWDRRLATGSGQAAQFWQSAA